ncbi:unnamed protein product [Pichia kudriavzevii]
MKKLTAAQLLLGYKDKDPMKSESEIITPSTSRNFNKVNALSLLTGNFSKHQNRKQTKKPRTSTRPSFFVTLRYSKRERVHAKNTSHPFFLEVKDKLKRQKLAPKLTIEKQLELPWLTRDQFINKNIDPIEEELLRRPLIVEIPNQKKNQPSLPVIEPSEFSLFVVSSLSKETRNDRPTCNITKTSILPSDEIFQKYQHLQFDNRFTKFFQNDYRSNTSNNTVSQWCDLYRPTCHSENLQKEYISSDIFNWISNAFLTLKSVDSNKRMLKLKRGANSTKDDFIVYSSDDDSDSKEDVPCLILEGPVGCGKTTLVYSIIEQLNGHVFEFSSNESRSKKNLEFRLNQIGTTTNLEQSNSIILFDDVDLINEDDKDFWSCVTNLLACSYRPVVLTTTSLKAIPDRIINESTIYTLESISELDLSHYIDFIALSRGLRLDNAIIDRFSKLSLRSAIMQLQFFSYTIPTQNSNVGLIDVTKNETNTKRKKIKLLSRLKKLSYESDIAYFTNTIKVKPLRDDFNEDKNSCLEFYSSKYFTHGKRSKSCRYSSGENYNKRHPTNVFTYLPKSTLAAEVLPFISEMANKEQERIENNQPRLFDIFPMDVFQ